MDDVPVKLEVFWFYIWRRRDNLSKTNNDIKSGRYWRTQVIFNLIWQSIRVLSMRSFDSLCQ